MNPALIRSYPAVLWATFCEICGGEIERRFFTKAEAVEAFENLRDHEGQAVCDGCWTDPGQAA